MTNFIEHIQIENFKSVQFCTIESLRRINLFIGRPNVGKSNIIEALSLFALPYIQENTPKKISNLIRVENRPELFFNGIINRESFVRTNLANAQLTYSPKDGLKVNLLFADQQKTAPVEYVYSIDEKLVIKASKKNEGFESPIKRYSYRADVTYKKSHSKYLIPPFGYNMLAIIEEYPDLKEQVMTLFQEYGLEIAFDKGSQSIKVIQSDAKDGIFLIPYNSIADTLQRIIFYKAAIASNNNSVLLFEEPEAHSFPPYMAHITQEMIHKNDNQFFVATHSPFILNDLLENAREELAVFVVHYEDLETKIKHLSDEELHDIFQNGVDLFTNSESFV